MYLLCSRRGLGDTDIFATIFEVPSGRECSVSNDKHALKQSHRQAKVYRSMLLVMIKELNFTVTMNALILTMNNDNDELVEEELFWQAKAL